jgi:hypothetical protein
MHVSRAVVVMVAMTLLAAGCKRKDAPPAQPPAPDPAPAPAQAPVVKSDLDLLREGIKDYVTLFADCDKHWFADVKPERLDRYELPVNVKAMEGECDKLLAMYEGILAKGSYRCPEMDSFLRLAASVADQYLVLAFRCKKVGVRDKVPYKKEVAALRDALRADVAKLKEAVGPALDLPDATLKGAGGGDAVALADAALTRVRPDFKQWVEAPVKESKPTWRYSLRTSDTLASKAAMTLRARAGVSAQPLVGPAEDLAKAYTAAVAFYTGNYFDTEEQEGPKIRAALSKADSAYRQAARKVLKPR